MNNTIDKNQENKDSKLYTLKDIEWLNFGLPLEKEINFKVDFMNKLKAEAKKCLYYGIEKYQTPAEISSKIIQNFMDFFDFDLKEEEKNNE